MVALRAEVASLKTRLSTQQATIDSQSMQIALLTSEVSEKASLYARAVVAIEARESEKAILRAENAELKSQLTAGLAQVRLIEGAAKDKLRREYERMAAELATALEMAQRTGDHVIRAKAARADELERMERERLANERRLREAAQVREFARRQTEAAAVLQQHQQQRLGHNAFVNAAIGEASSEDDANFEGGSSSSGDGSEESTDSDAEDGQVLQDALARNAQLAALAQIGVQVPLVAAAAATHLAVPMAAAIEEGVIPGGLAVISPAMSPQPSADLAEEDSALAAASADAMQVLEASVLLAEADTSGETTEQTTTVTTGTDSQQRQQQQLNTSSEMTSDAMAQVLVMDSEELPVGRRFLCRWDADMVDPCRFHCASRQALYLHLEAVHASDAEAPVGEDSGAQGMLLT